jgi:hypothetical protein
MKCNQGKSLVTASLQLGQTDKNASGGKMSSTEVDLPRLSNIHCSGTEVYASSALILQVRPLNSMPLGESKSRIRKNDS